MVVLPCAQLTESIWTLPQAKCKPARVLQKYEAKLEVMGDLISLMRLKLCLFLLTESRRLASTEELAQTECSGTAGIIDSQ